jgi:hypothetical protein
MISNNEVIFRNARPDGVLEGYVETNLNFTAICCGQTLVGGKYNVLCGNYATVVGGENNCGCGNYLSIVGGQFNNVFASGSSVVGGECNQTCSDLSFIGGGVCNRITNTSKYSFIGGGIGNVASVNLAVVVGGQSNYANGFNSIVGGGFCNVVDASHSSIVGGSRNRICEGGCGNTNAIVGGNDNTIGPVIFNSFIGNGCSNHITNNSSSVFIGNGYCNRVSSSYIGSSYVSTILNGSSNCITAPYGTILNGSLNEIQGVWSSSNLIGGGSENKIGTTTSDTCSWSKYSTILNGLFNCVVGTNVQNGECANVSLFSSILGGSNNIIRGDYGSILGGSCNTIAANNGLILGGKCINITHNGAAVIGDAYVNTKNSQGAYTLSLDYINGTYIKNKLILQDAGIVYQSRSPGISGQISFDKDYLYRHNGDNWTKVQMGTGDNLFLTGSALATYNTNYSGWVNNTYATVSNLASTGNALVTSLVSTGSALVTYNRNYSGWANNTYATISNLFLTGSNIIATRITGVNIQAGSSDIGQAKTLNFVGAGVSASVTNAIATITVAGGGAVGGGNVSYVSVPATPNSAGSSAQIATDGKYFYSHNGSKWRRTALSEW